MPTIHIRVSEELLARLDEQAATDGRTRAGMAERLLVSSLGEESARRMPRMPRERIEVTGGKPYTAGTDLADGVGDHVNELVEAKATGKRVRPGDICDHQKEYRHCTIAYCKAALAVGGV